MFAISVYLIFSMLAVMWFDCSRFMIPNWLTGSLLALYPVALFLSNAHTDWKMALAGMGIVFAVGYGVFAMKWMGGGDIKLITVLALWVGWKHLLNFIFLFAFLGGVFAFGVLIARKLRPYIPIKKTAASWPRIMRDGEPVPYGVAIAMGFVILLWMGQVPLIH